MRMSRSDDFGVQVGRLWHPGRMTFWFLLSRKLTCHDDMASSVPIFLSQPTRHVSTVWKWFEYIISIEESIHCQWDTPMYTLWSLDAALKLKSNDNRSSSVIFPLWNFVAQTLFQLKKKNTTIRNPPPERKIVFRPLPPCYTSTPATGKMSDPSLLKMINLLIRKDDTLICHLARSY